MLKNDLSNRAAPILAFNFEKIICEEFHKNFFGIKYTLNKQHINAINNLYWNDFSIFYVTFEVPGKRLDKLEQELDEYGCLYNGTIRVADVNSLLFFLRSHRSAFYYDTDKNLVDMLIHSVIDGKSI